MDKRMKPDNYYEYCKGQCGYGPYCSECMKEKIRKWEMSLQKKVSDRKCTKDDVR